MPETSAQPPFLLRWSPARIAEEAQQLFEHDPATNRLSLRAGVIEPWLRKVYGRPSDKDVNSWVYCDSCRERIGDSGRRRSHIPFRALASQHYMKPVARQGTPVSEVEPRGEAAGTQPEPEHEPQQGDLPDDPVVQMEVDNAPQEDDPREDEWVPQAPQPAAPQPSLEEYQRKWDERKALHERAVPGDFALENLVPRPNHRLWQATIIVLALIAFEALMGALCTMPLKCGLPALCV